MSEEIFLKRLLQDWMKRVGKDWQMVLQSVLIGVVTALAVYFMHWLVTRISLFCQGLGTSLSEAKYTFYVLLPLPFPRRCSEARTF